MKKSLRILVIALMVTMLCTCFDVVAEDGVAS